MSEASEGPREDVAERAPEMGAAAEAEAVTAAEAGAGRRMRRPTPGERARTLAYGVADGVLAVPGVPYAPVAAHTTDENGRPLLLVPAVSAAVKALRGEPDVPATLRISDVAPVPLPDRVRGRAWLHGWVSQVPDEELRASAVRLSRLHPRPELLDIGPGRAARWPRWTVLAMEIAEVEVRDVWGGATLVPEEYEAAVPDPFVAIEGGILSHLDECHRAELVTMLRRLNGAGDRVDGDRVDGGGPAGGGVPRARAGDGLVVRPLALDRYGMWLRCSGQGGKEPRDGGPLDLRVVFGEPVSDMHGLRCVYRRLFAGAHS